MMTIEHEHYEGENSKSNATTNNNAKQSKNKTVKKSGRARIK